MSLAVTLLGSATFDTNAGSKSVTATPSVDDLILIVTAHTGNTSTTPPTDDKGGTYSLINSTFKNTSADGLAVFVRDQLISSAASTVFTHNPGTTTGGGLAVLKVTGSTGGLAAIRQSAKEINKTTAGTPAPVFSSTPKSSNAILGAVFIQFSSPSIDPRSGYTERVDVAYSTPSANLEIMSRDSGETSATVAWGSGTAFAYCDIVVEITSTTPLTPSLVSNSNTFYAPSVRFAAFAASFLTNSNTFYGPAISVTGGLSASLLSNANSFYSPSIAFAPFTPSLVANDNTFYGASVGLVSDLSADLFVNDSAIFPPIISGWFTQSEGGETWTARYPGNILLDENGNPILDENGDYITDGTETWTAATDNSTTWTQAS